MKSLCFFFFLTFLLSFSDARRFNVGGSGAWVPNPPVNYQSWAEQSRFLVQDTLYFNYAKGADSVLEVNKADFEACNTKNPIKKMEDGETEVTLDRSGPFYFITGNEDNCKKGQKISVVVLSVKHAAAPGSSPPGTPSGSMAPKSSSPASPTTSPPGSMAPKSSSPMTPTTSPPAPGSMAPKSSSTGSPMASPPAPVSPSSAPGSSSPGSMAPRYSSAFPPSSAPGESPSSSPSDSPSESPPAPSPTGSELGPSGNGPSAAGDISTPAGAPGAADQKKSPANRMAVMSVTTVLLSFVLTLFVSA